MIPLTENLIERTPDQICQLSGHPEDKNFNDVIGSKQMYKDLGDLLLFTSQWESRALISQQAHNSVFMCLVGIRWEPCV